MAVLLNPHQLRLLVVLAALSTIAFAVVRVRRFIIHRQFIRRHGCRPLARRVNRDPILGLDNAYSLITAARQHKSLELHLNRFLRLGNTYASNSLRIKSVMTREPENIKAVLATNFKDFGIGHRLKFFGPLLGHGIFDSDGDHWAQSRSLVRPSFTRDQVADLTAFEELIPDLLAHIPRDGETTVDLQELFFRYTIDSATEFLFGQSVGSLKKKKSELDFADAFNYSQKAITKRFLMGPLGSLHSDPKADECNKICREFAQKFVDEAFAAVQAGENGEKDDGFGSRLKYIFSHELARRTTDKRRILDELMNILLAGRDTTASMLSNMFFMFAKNPKIWAKLRREVAGLEGRLPTYEELRNLRYLKCCLNESLRVHPVVPMNRRIAIKDTYIPVGGGDDGLSPVFIPKGNMVGYNVYAMHRREDFYGPDAETFRPERWEDGTLQPRWEYLPFNGGPRICVGQQYALTEVGYVTVRLAQEFEKLQSMDAGPWEEDLTLTLCSRNGTKVRLTPA